MDGPTSPSPSPRPSHQSRSNGISLLLQYTLTFKHLYLHTSAPNTHTHSDKYETALTVALKFGRFELADMILKKRGANIDHQSNNGNTSLLLATFANKVHTSQHHGVFHAPIAPLTLGFL